MARNDVEYVLDTFRAGRHNDRFAATRKAVLEVYDDMAAAIASGTAFRGTLDPPAARGPRHPATRHAEG